MKLDTLPGCPAGGCLNVPYAARKPYALAASSYGCRCRASLAIHGRISTQMPRQPNPEPRNAYGYPERSRPGYSTRLGSREQADWRDRLQRPRYALAIAIGIGLAPFLYHFGWYVGDVQLPRWITERAR